jgi:hypothetical protein
MWMMLTHQNGSEVHVNMDKVLWFTKLNGEKGTMLGYQPHADGTPYYVKVKQSTKEIADTLAAAYRDEDYDEPVTPPWTGSLGDDTI